MQAVCTIVRTETTLRKQSTQCRSALTLAGKHSTVQTRVPAASSALYCLVCVPTTTLHASVSARSLAICPAHSPPLTCMLSAARLLFAMTTTLFVLIGTQTLLCAFIWTATCVLCLYGVLVMRAAAPSREWSVSFLCGAMPWAICLSTLSTFVSPAVHAPLPWTAWMYTSSQIQ